MRDKAVPRRQSRVRLAFREFLALPCWLLACWLLIAALSIVLDRGQPSWFQPVSGALASVVPGQASATMLAALAPGLITVNSIIFFVLVMAVQHQSAAYSPVVLDQFLRRGMNQVFFGLLLGETVFAVLVLGLVPSGLGTLSGAIALLAIVATLALLLVFIYTTVDQMRPSATTWKIRQLGLHARARQSRLLSRCRSYAELTDAPGEVLVSERTGYVVDIEADRLADAVRGAQGRVEIELTVLLGGYLVPGERFAVVRGERQEDLAPLCTAVCNAVIVSRMPNLGTDAGHAVCHLGSMAWSAAATSDPEGARNAVNALYSLLAHWDDEQRTDGSEPLPIVYHDDVVKQVIDALTSVIVAAGTSKQHQTCGHAMHALSAVLPLLSKDNQRHTVDRLQRVMPTAMHQIYSVQMEQAFDALWAALGDANLAGQRDRVAQIKRDLAREHTLADP